MKYYSDNKSIEEALNKTWRLTIFVFILTFGLIILGFYLATQYQLSWLLPTTFLVSLPLGYIVSIILIKNWFKKWLILVDDPYELYRRARQLNLIFPSTAKKIANKLCIDIYTNKYKLGNFIELPSKQINKLVNLTKHSIIIGNKTFLWKEIKSFELTPYYRSNFFGPTLDLVLYFNNNQSESFPLRIKKPFDLEYNLDKYFENGKKINT
jgi:hypothetical protein